MCELELPSPIRETYATLRVLAWGVAETPEMSDDEIVRTIGKDPWTVLYRHAPKLAEAGVLHVRRGGNGGHVFVFTDGITGAEDMVLQKCKFSKNANLAKMQNGRGFKDLKDSESLEVNDSVNLNPLPFSKNAKIGKNAKSALAALQELFCELTGLPSPTGKTDKEKRRDAVRWYQPLRRIFKAADGKSDEVLRQAVGRMRRSRLTISAPQSVENTALAIMGEMNTGVGASALRDVTHD